MVQWLRLHIPNAGEPGFDQRTRSHMLQLKILCATTKTQPSQINKQFRKTILCSQFIPEERHVENMAPYVDTEWAPWGTIWS